MIFLTWSSNMIFFNTIFNCDLFLAQSSNMIWSSRSVALPLHNSREPLPCQNWSLTTRRNNYPGYQTSLTPPIWASWWFLKDFDDDGQNNDDGNGDWWYCLKMVSRRFPERAPRQFQELPPDRPTHTPTQDIPLKPSQGNSPWDQHNHHHHHHDLHHHLDQRNKEKALSCKWVPGNFEVLSSNLNDGRWWWFYVDDDHHHDHGHNDDFK